MCSEQQCEVIGKKVEMGGQMKKERKDDVVTIFLEGRIDTNNAPRIDEEIQGILSENEGVTPVFDASELAYISSAGLRVLMKARKSVEAPIDVIEVSPEVYDIFETTGFTDLLNVKKKLKEISVDGCEFIGAGAYGRVYRIDDETIIKVYNEGVSQSFVEGERKSSQDAFKLGIPTAISFHMAKVGNQYGVIYELFNANTIAQLITADPARLKDLGVKMALKLKELHQIEVPVEQGFESRKDILKKWISTLEGLMNEDEISKMNALIDSIPDRRTFLHGDYNSKNIMLQDDEILLIDLGDAAYGHPIFDIASLILPYIILPNRPQIAEDERRHLLGFDPSLAGQLWGVMCGAYFGVTSPEEIEAITKQMMPLAQLLIAFQGITTGRTKPEIMVEHVIRPQLIPMLGAGVQLKLDF